MSGGTADTAGNSVARRIQLSALQPQPCMSARPPCIGARLKLSLPKPPPALSHRHALNPSPPFLQGCAGVGACASLAAAAPHSQHHRLSHCHHGWPASLAAAGGGSVAVPAVQR